MLPVAEAPPGLRAAHPGRGDVGVLDRAQRLAVHPDLVGQPEQRRLQQPAQAFAGGEPQPHLGELGERPLRLGRVGLGHHDPVTGQSAGQTGQLGQQRLGGGDVIGPQRAPMRVVDQPAQPVGPGTLATAQPGQRLGQIGPQTSQTGALLTSYRRKI